MTKKNRLAGFLSIVLRIVYFISVVAMVILGILSIVSLFAVPLQRVIDQVGDHELTIAFMMSDFVDRARTFISAVMFVVISKSLMVVLQTISNGTPFESDNANRFSLIAKVVVYCEIAKFAIVPFGAIVGSMFGVPIGDLADGGFWPNPTNFIGAGIALVLAEVFREGARLREEQEFTV